MSQILYLFNQISPFLLHIVCFSVAWLLVFSLIWSTYRMLTQGITRVKKLHKIPCSTCKFFTGNYQLKCTINPKIALTEQAINCSDFSDYQTLASYRGEPGTS